MVNPPQDKKYVQALAKDDTKAFEILFLYYQPKLIYFLSGFTHNEEVSRDLAQDIFLSVWNNRKKMAYVDSFSSYLFRMAKNALYNYYDHVLVSEKFDKEHCLSGSEFISIEEELFARELQHIINNEIEEMSPQRKKIFRMSRIENLTNEEIADKLNISKRTVENHLTYILSRLRNALKIIKLLFY